MEKDLDYLAENEEDDAIVGDSLNTIFTQDVLAKGFALFDEKALRDKLTIISFFVTVFECFKAQVISDIKSVYAMPIEFDEKGLFKYEQSDEYDNEVLGLVRDKNGKTIPDPLKATMLWLRHQGAITYEDFGNFKRLRTLRNNYVHNMAKYVVDGVSMDDYKELETLLNLFKKIRVWFTLNIDGPRTWPDEVIAQGIDESSVTDLLILMFETMAKSLGLI